MTMALSMSCRGVGNTWRWLPRGTRHKVVVTCVEDGFEVAIQSGSAALAQELARTFPTAGTATHGFVLQSESELAHWLRRAATLSQALPNQAVTAFEQQVQAELSAMPAPTAQNTEVLCARCGSGWGNRPTAKPWAECATDAERLDVYNGFLLSANLDALFDNFLISFTDEGVLLVAEQIDHWEREKRKARPG